MSLSIRQQLGKIKNRAVEIYDRYKKLTPKWNNDTIEAACVMLPAMEKQLKRLHDKFEQWQTLVDDIEEDADRDKEEKLLNEWQENDDYANLIEDLEIAVSTTTRLSKISSTRESTSIVQPVTTSITAESLSPVIPPAKEAIVLLEVPPGFEQQPQRYLEAPPGFELAVTSTSNVSSTPTDIVQTRDQSSIGVKDGGMSLNLNLVGGEGLSEKASNSSMPVSRGSNVMEGRKKYGIFRRPTIRVTARSLSRGSTIRGAAIARSTIRGADIVRSRLCKSTVCDAGIVRSRSCAWDTVLHQINRGPSTYIVYDAFIIIVFDGGGNSSTVIVILDNSSHRSSSSSWLAVSRRIRDLCKYHHSFLAYLKLCI